MPVNKSVERFRQLSNELQQTVRQNAIDELNRQGNILKEAIAAVAPVYQGPATPGVQAGALKTSVNLVQGSKPTIVRIVAGGYLTVRQSVSGRPFDYARADEFGTQKMQARPFFFPTYRLRKKKIIASMKRRIASQIKKYSAEQKGASDV
jgi:HK97 gp10 family phage protein